MKQRNSTMSKLAGILVLAVVCLWAGCGDGPTGPGRASEYPIYYCDVGRIPSKLFKLYPNSSRIDSVDIPWLSRRGLTVSADGGLIYLADRDAITVVETDSFHLVTTLPYEPHDPVGVSPDGSLIAIATDNGLHLLRTENYSEEFSDTTPVSNCMFSADSKTVYCEDRNTGSVYYVHLDTPNRVPGRIDVGGGAVYILPTSDKSKLLLYRLTGAYRWNFEVFDVQADSVIFVDVLYPGAGHMAVSTDGRLAFYTSPGINLNGPPPLYGFKIFDLEANEIVRVFDDTAYFRGEGYGASPHYLTVTPDGRWLGIVAGTINRLAVYVYDIERESLHIEVEPRPPQPPWYTNISTQNGRRTR